MFLSKINRILNVQKSNLNCIYSLQRCSTDCQKKTDDKRSNYDLVIVGGGIVGVASAREIITRHPNLKIALLEKESKLALHQTGHNSGVIHAGIYYTPGTLKAKLCVEGMKLCYDYCDKKGIPYKKVGKLIVATTPIEVERLFNLYERAKANKVQDLKLVENNEGIRKIEPHCEGLKALHSPHTGIVDFTLMTNHFGEDFKKAGGDIYLNYKALDFKQDKDSDYPIIIKGDKDQQVRSKYVLTCGGLQSDLLAEKSGCSKQPKIIPFRGEYLLLSEEKAKFVRGNIYPVPDPKFPFLGVHLTPRMDGSVWIGPNAVLAFKREGYRPTDINISELIDSLKYPGFLKLAMKYLKNGTWEVINSIFISLQVKQVQRFIPEIRRSDVKRGPTGVRAQALDIDGNLIEDFVFDSGKEDIGARILHCRNAPSPGATSSLAIAKMVADKTEAQFNLKKIL